MFIFATLTRVIIFSLFYLMLRFLLNAMLLIVMTIPMLSVFAATGANFTTTGVTNSWVLTIDTTTTTTTPTIGNVPLLLDTIRITNAKSITLVFNQAVRADTVRVRIIDQETNESVKILSITESTTSGALAIINTASALTAGASYVLTITSAFSLTDMTIKAGIDSIREFTVPVSLPGASLNAPSNPSAILVGSTSGSKTLILSGAATPVPQATVQNEALPATGMPIMIVIILAAMSALGLLMIRKRA